MTSDEKKKPQANAQEHLLDTASQIMRDGDTLDLSLSELSLRSGLNSALVKYYFGNKQGLMLGLLERDMRNIVRSIDTLMSKEISAEEKLRIYVAAVIRTYYKYPYLNRLLMRMVRDLDLETSRKIADNYLLPITEAYEQLLDEGVRTGQFRKIDPQYFHFAVTGAADRFFAAKLVLQHCYNNGELTEKMCNAYAEHTLDIILHGIALKH